MDSEISWANMMYLMKAVEKMLQSSEPNSQNTHILLTLWFWKHKATILEDLHVTMAHRAQRGLHH